MGRCCSQNISLPSPHLGRIAIFLSEAALFLLSASKPNVNVTSSTVFSLRPQASHRGQSSLLGQERRPLPPGTPFQTRATIGLARRGQYTTKERSLKGQGHEGLPSQLPDREGGGHTRFSPKAKTSGKLGLLLWILICLRLCAVAGLG